MAEWNASSYYNGYGQNDRGAHSGNGQDYYESRPNNRPYGRIPPQYVGFDDFLHQFQNPNYPGNSSQSEAAGYSGYVVMQDIPDSAERQAPRRNPPQQKNNRNPPVNIAVPSIPQIDEANYPESLLENKENGASVRQPSSNRNQKHREKKPFNRNGVRNSKDFQDIASTSKLTATALEFVPQNRENVKPNMAEVNRPQNARPATVEPFPQKNTPRTNSRSDGWNSKSAQPRRDNVNWRNRIRSEDEDKEPQQTNSPSGSTFTVYNSNSASKDEDYHSNNRKDNANRKNRGNDQSRVKRELYQKGKSSNSNDPVERDYSNSSDRNRGTSNETQYSNQEPERNQYGYRQTKPSYSMNESFQQRGSSAQWRQDQGSEGESRGYSQNHSTGRPKSNPNPRHETTKKNHSDNKDVESADASQRDRLTDQLNRGALECLVCCDRVRQPDHIWSCSNCYHVLHLKCVIKWANTSIADGQWRCPACQNKMSSVPREYRCFCSKRANPEWSRGADAAHTCGDTCAKRVSCERHPCTLLCHAGPCPLCNATVQKKCECGASSQWVRCSIKQPLLCGGVCGKGLQCQIHECAELCHKDKCPPCPQIVDQQCFCPKAAKRNLPCDSESVGVTTFSCGEVCMRKLTCGNHECDRICHSGACPECPLMPEKVSVCPCGQTLLTAEQKRKSCLEPVPLCGKMCSKMLTCGPPDSKHTCKSLCHHGPCPPCPDKTTMPCRCAHTTKDIICVNLEKERDNVKCGKKCNKKQSCGRHRCRVLCCVDVDHRCPVPCNRTLTCGLHRCEDTCHSGHCDTCWRTSFDELRCRCGAAVRYPPVECGARPPTCTQPCPQARTCGHPPLHLCHPAPHPCPPCTVLTTRYCHGKHKMRKTIPCHQDDFSCGLPCGKEISCGKHKCIEICHKGDCPAVCTQACAVERSECGHMCGSLCGHTGPCPSRLACKRLVRAVCPCGRQSCERPCADNWRDLQRLLAAGAGALMGATGEPVDIGALIATGKKTTTLECDNECQMIERNRRMAIGLQIRNPDLTAKLTPRYSEFLKTFALRDEGFGNKVHDNLTQLVLLAQKSKQKTRSHSFQPMNRQKRQFVHEMCEHFGCESVAYDAEPYRNIVATAFREKSWLPAMSLLEVLRRDKGQRKVPGPVATRTLSSTGNAWAKLGNNSSSTDLFRSSSGNSLNAMTSTVTVEVPPPKPRIDYFDCPPED